MIFTRTRKEADSVTAMLKGADHAKAVAMHSDINQKDRMKALAGFKDGSYNILVATDVAARGIDVSGVTHVINYRVPENAEDYVHRIGRTGRAEKEGDAFTILTADELENAVSIENFISRKIERKKLDNFDYIYTALLDDSPARPVRKKRPSRPQAPPPLAQQRTASLQLAPPVREKHRFVSPYPSFAPKKRHLIRFLYSRISPIFTNWISNDSIRIYQA